MSIETWKDEFMPRAADHPVALAEPVQHSLRKWRGLTQENLKRHGLRQVDVGIYADDTLALEVNSDSCALCQVHLFKDTGCESCPLSIVRNGVPCDEEAEDGLEAPYQAFTQDEDPTPMIALLEKALEAGYE